MSKEKHPKMITYNGHNVFIREKKFRRKPFSQPNLFSSPLFQRKLNSYLCTTKHVFPPIAVYDSLSFSLCPSLPKKQNKTKQKP